MWLGFDIPKPNEIGRNIPSENVPKNEAHQQCNSQNFMYP